MAKPRELEGVKTKALDNKWKVMERGKLLVHALHAE